MSEKTPVVDMDVMRNEFSAAYDADEPQRKREEEDLRFQVPEHQWDEDSKINRAGGKDPATGVIKLPKPMLSVSRVDQPIRLVMTQFRQAKFGVNIHPVSEHASKETATFLQELYRRIERDSNANVARGWALERAVKAGRGKWRVVVRPDEDGYRYGDLEVGIERFLYQSAVLLDPAAREPDWSDGEFAYITEWRRLSDAARKFEKLRGRLGAVANGDKIAWANMRENAPLWAQERDGVKTIQIAQRYWKDHNEINLLILDNGQVIVEGEGKVPNGRKVIAERQRDRVCVYSAITDGFELLTKVEKWFGKYIPIVVVLGRELQPYDDQRRIEGMIRPARDAQRLFNTAASTMLEEMFLEPRVPWVGPEGFAAGREAQWARANYDNIPFLYYKPTQYDDGKPHQPPTRTPRDQTGVSTALLAMQEAGTLVQDATGYFDPSIGKRDNRQESGRKVLALQSQGDAANADWLDNFAIALHHEARMVLDIVAPADPERVGVYDAPGRVTTVLGGPAGDKPRKAMVNRYYVTDEQTGIPRAAKKGEEGARIHDLRNGARYGISIEVGTGYKTRLQEADEVTTRIVEAAPEMLGLIGDLLFRAKDFPFAAEIADRMEASIRASHPEMFKGKEGPEELAARAQGAEAQVSQLTQIVQQLQQEKLVEAEKYASAERIKAMEFEFKARLAEIENGGRLMIERMKLAGGQAKVREEAQKDTALTVMDQAHESEENALQRDHERHMQHEELAQEMALAAGGGNSVTRTREGGQEMGQEHTREHSSGGSAEQTSESGAEPRGASE